MGPKENAGETGQALYVALSLFNAVELGKALWTGAKAAVGLLKREVVDVVGARIAGDRALRQNLKELVEGEAAWEAERARAEQIGHNLRQFSQFLQPYVENPRALSVARINISQPGTVGGTPISINQVQATCSGAAPLQLPPGLSEAGVRSTPTRNNSIFSVSSIHEYAGPPKDIYSGPAHKFVPRMGKDAATKQFSIKNADKVDGTAFARLHGGKRDYDSEQKIFEDVAYQLEQLRAQQPPGVPFKPEGTIDMASSLEMCPHCQSLAHQFRSLYPGVTVRVHTPQYPPAVGHL